MPVTGIRASKVNSDSAIIHWNKPEKPTGPIAYYKVIYRYTDFRGELKEKESMPTSRSLKISGLASNVVYQVFVTVCIEMPDHGEPLCGKNKGAISLTTGPGGILS